MLKLGFNEATCMKNSSVEADLKLCEKHGYDYIELRLDMLKDYFQSHSIRDLQNFFSQSHLKPFAFNSIENINFNTPTQWETLLDLFKFGCETAQAIHNPYMIVVPTATSHICNKNEKEVLEDSVKVLHALADIAKPYGVKLSFEPIGDRHWCCNSMRQGMEIVQAVNRDDVGLTVDCINFYLHDKCSDIGYLKHIPRDKLFVFHINDCEDLPLGILDHCHRLFPGDGIIPVQQICDAVQSIGYNEMASLELFRPEYWKMDPEDVIRTGAEKCLHFFRNH